MRCVGTVQFAAAFTGRACLGVSRTRYRWWSWRSSSYAERGAASTSKRCWSAIGCGSRSRAGCRSPKRKSDGRRSWPNACAAASIRRAIDVAARARRLAREYGLPRPRSVRWVDNMRQRWGSCTPEDGSIRVSSRLAAYPSWVLDYVLVHEIAHLVVPNHGPAARRARRPVPARRAGPGLPDRRRPRSRRRATTIPAARRGDVRP